MSQAETHGRERLTRERIVETAMRIMDLEGLEAVTMRRVGRDLGVEAMSLYNHVRDKEEILDAITERVMAEFRVPEPTASWTDDARVAAREWRRLLQEHPNALRLFAEREKPMANPEAFRPMESALEILRRAGLSDRDSVQAFHAFGGYIFGFVLMELGMMLRPEAGGAHEHEQLGRLLSESGFTNLSSAFPYFADCSTDEQFEFGLD
ncbi:MAG: TetR/AcrR family transcriptional regulator, partial [Actinobacteria bacterium]|nr:TetR/AcrR family transcriptional regulator [Actinomycetota bacterium]